MLEFAFEPINRDPWNPTTRLRFLEVARALRRLGVAADLQREVQQATAERSETLERLSRLEENWRAELRRA